VALLLLLLGPARSQQATNHHHRCCCCCCFQAVTSAAQQSENFVGFGGWLLEVKFLEKKKGILCPLPAWLWLDYYRREQN